MNYLNNYGYGNNTSYPQSYQPQQPVQQNYGLRSGLQYATKAEMEALFIAPSTQVMALGKEGDVFYIKSCDELGRSTMATFDYKKHEDQAQPKVEYLTKTDLDDVYKKIKALEDKLLMKKPEVKNG